MQQPLLQAQLDDEEQAFLAANPAIAQQLDALTQSVAQRFEQISQSPDELIWQANWHRRWQIAYFASALGLSETQLIQQFQKDYPNFAEYQQLRREVTTLLPSLNENPVVKTFANVSDAVLADTTVNASIRQAYTRYTGEVTTALDGSTVPDIIETFSANLIALLNANAGYRALRTEEQSVQQLEAYQQSVHDAVARCYQRDAKGCKPERDPAVVALINGSQTQPLINKVGAFYEHTNQFWYAFYNGDDYLALENDTKAKLKIPSAPCSRSSKQRASSTTPRSMASRSCGGCTAPATRWCVDSAPIRQRLPARRSPMHVRRFASALIAWLNWYTS